jgi:hypothetical protein
VELKDWANSQYAPIGSATTFSSGEHRIVDDFTGWSSGTTNQITGAENIHGPYGNPSDPTTVSKTFSLPAHTSLTVKARYYSVGSWDVEADPNLKVTLTLTLTLTLTPWPITPCDPLT